MQTGAEHDAKYSAIVREWAQRFLALPYVRRAAAILRFVQRTIEYVRDPATFDAKGRRHGIEVLESSAIVLLRGYGDCDAKARLFVALCLAAGIVAGISPVFTGETGFPHVRAWVEASPGSAPSLADPCILNSEIGRIPKHGIITNSRGIL
jgi:transglutaminase-like putative cysteine protease